MKKKFIILPVFWFFFCFSVGCNRADMFNFISEEIELIYAVSDDGGVKKLLVASDEGYNQLYDLPIPSTHLVNSIFAGPERIWICAEYTTLLYFYSCRYDSLESGWSEKQTGLTGFRGMANFNGKFVFGAQINTNGINYFQEDGSLVSIDLSTTAPSALSTDVGGIFLFSDSLAVLNADTGSTFRFYYYKNGELSDSGCTGYSEAGGISGGIHSLKIFGDQLFLGSGARLVRSDSSIGGSFNLVTIGGGPGGLSPLADSYAFLDKDNIFMGRVVSGNPEISKYNNADSFAAVETVTDGSAVKTLIREYGKNIAVSISSSGDSKGVYVYNPGTDSMQKIYGGLNFIAVTVR